jgi:hypothetical protein
MIHEAPDHNEVLRRDHAAVAVSPRTYEQPFYIEKVPGTIQYDLVPAPLRSAVAPEPWSPESITGGRMQSFEEKVPVMDVSPVMMQRQDPYMQSEVQVSRSKSSRPKSRWKTLWQK